MVMETTTILLKTITWVAVWEETQLDHQVETQRWGVTHNKCKATLEWAVSDHKDHQWEVVQVSDLASGLLACNPTLALFSEMPM